MSLDIWMRENVLTYVLIGSYAVALLVFAIEVMLIRHKRKTTLHQVRLMRNTGDWE
jgi:hypothetical protein